MASKSKGSAPTPRSGAIEKIGNGGELHQVASEGQDRLTTAFGHVVGDDQNGLGAGQRGPTLSILAKAGPILTGRQVGCLVTDGANAGAVAALRKSVETAGAKFLLIAPKVGGATL